MKAITSTLGARTFLRAVASLLPAVIVLLVLAASSSGAQTIPTDPKPTCTVTSTQFKGWFVSGTPTLNGAVNPANSVTFPNSPNCSFYQWSKQMFLWLTSPAPATYGGGNVRVMDSPVFYDVSPESNGKRTFIPHTPGFLRTFQVRAAQVGPHGLPVVVSTSGRLIEFKPAAPTARPMVKNSAGALVPLTSVSRDVNRKLVLKDNAGKLITPAIRPELLRPMNVVIKNEPATLFKISGIPILIDSTGNVIETEEGQAGGNGVLLSQGKSLVYYVTMVNDVYAYFATMVAHQPVASRTAVFPTTQASLNPIVTFAAAHGKTFPDPNALAIEVKSSWVVASTLPNNAAGYITMQATIPTYNTSSNTTWTPNATPKQNVTLALVGMHVVGSTAGHGEMVWATFEHFGNSPNQAYQYVNSSGVTKSIAADSGGPWLFAVTNPPSTGFNALHATFNAPNIVAVSGQTISPSNTSRVMAWGSTSNTAPNPLVSAALSNTDIISIHDSVKSMMPAGDIRSNYFMTGATWTEGGANPSSPFPSGNQVGTSQLNNSTMETYQQSSNTTTIGTNCLDCHTNTDGKSFADTTISHIFPALLNGPLF